MSSVEILILILTFVIFASVLFSLYKESKNKVLQVDKKLVSKEIVPSPELQHNPFINNDITIGLVSKLISKVSNFYFAKTVSSLEKKGRISVCGEAVDVTIGGGFSRESFHLNFNSKNLKNLSSKEEIESFAQAIAFRFETILKMIIDQENSKSSFFVDSISPYSNRDGHMVEIDFRIIFINKNYIPPKEKKKDWF